MQKQILFLGMPDMALVCLNKLINEKLNIRAVILPDKSNPSRQNMAQSAKNNNIEILEYEKTPNEEGFAQKIRALNCDIGVMCSFNHKLSSDIIKSTKEGIINCHPSLLPYYRGANPYYHIIKNGETVSGVTLHFVDENFDTGRIIAQESFPLMKKETMGMLFSRTNFMIAELLNKVLHNYCETGEIPSTAQETGTYPKAPNVPPETYINWSDNVIKTERLIRASNPFYNVLTNFRGGYIRIISGDYKLERHNHTPGTIVKVTKDFMKIASSGGYYFPDVIQAGSWGIYSIKEFIEKFNPHRNEVLR